MTTPDFINPLEMPDGITLHPVQGTAMDRVLDDLTEKTPAQFVLLTEAGGQILATRGEKQTADMVALSTLVAGDMAASREIARLTNQYRSGHWVLREGPDANTFTAEAGPRMVLFVGVGTDVPLGWARLLIQEAGRQLAEVVAAPHGDVTALELGLDEAKLSALFGDRLDSLWKE
jgi:hypothetical protein